MYNYDMTIRYDKKENILIAKVPFLHGYIADGKTYEKAARKCPNYCTLIN
ncbi:MAG: hypothetical protein M1576_01470 [Deltaproteobacteria bacterium]|jgi:predicted RNase H-like HicB family nuclease|nr:hypothetical protein [Deltaproteobacteria bacterium]